MSMAARRSTPPPSPVAKSTASSSPRASTPSPADPPPFRRDGQRLLYYHSGATAPNDLYVFDLKSKQSTQLTNSFVAGLSSSSMVTPTLVHYPSRDGKFTISAWAYVPNNIVRNGKYPAIVYIHGGPASQSMDGFNRFVQYMNNQGYLVIAPNYRGGTGYGREFQEGNRHDAGGEELNDVLGAAEFILRTGFVDPAKLIVMGGSYGGYLTMMAVTRHPEMWAAAVPIVPFVNWFTESKTKTPSSRSTTASSWATRSRTRRSGKTARPSTSSTK